MGINSYSKSVFVLVPLSEAGEKFVDEYVNYESWQMMGTGIAIEWRYIDSIIDAIIEAGLKRGKDFAVY